MAQSSGAKSRTWTHVLSHRGFLSDYPVPLPRVCRPSQPPERYRSGSVAPVPRCRVTLQTIHNTKGTWRLHHVLPFVLCLSTFILTLILSARRGKRDSVFLA
eukprot:4350458-Prymnesium_polylepis.1